MNTIYDYITVIKQNRSKIMHDFGVKSLRIFGSVARNEQTEESDVDICIEMNAPDLFNMVHIKEDLQKLFGRNVDIVRLRKNMNPMLLNQIERDGVYA